MQTLAVQFKGFWGMGGKRGEINITNPTNGVIISKNLIYSGETIKHPLAGDWSGFPRKVDKILVGVFDEKMEADMPAYFFIDVARKAQGEFRGEVILVPGQKIIPVKFLGLAANRFSTGIPFAFMQDHPYKMLFSVDYRINVHWVEEIDSPIVKSIDDFSAKISKIMRGTHASGDIAVVAWFDVQQAPEGTDALSLAFVTDTDQEYPQSVKPWNDPQEYSFEAHIWSGHLQAMGKPAGALVKTKAILRAYQLIRDEKGQIEKGENGEAKVNVLGELEEIFTLDSITG